MQFSISQDGDVTVMRLTGHLDHLGSEAAEGRIEDELREKPPKVVVDLDQAGLIASAGLMMLLKLRRLCQARGGDLTLSNLSPRAQRVLHVTSLERVFRLAPTVAEAVADFGRGA